MYEYDIPTDTIKKMEVPLDGFSMIFSLELTYKFARMYDSLKPMYQFRILSEAVGITQLYLEYMSRAHFSLTPYDITTADLAMRARDILEGLCAVRAKVKLALRHVDTKRRM